MKNLSTALLSVILFLPGCNPVSYKPTTQSFKTSYPCVYDTLKGDGMIEAQKKAGERFIDAIKEKLSAIPIKQDTINLIKTEDLPRGLFSKPVKGEY